MAFQHLCKNSCCGAVFKYFIPAPRTNLKSYYDFFFFWHKSTLLCGTQSVDISSSQRSHRSPPCSQLIKGKPHHHPRATTCPQHPAQEKKQILNLLSHSSLEATPATRNTCCCCNPTVKRWSEFSKQKHFALVQIVLKQNIIQRRLFN